VKPRQPPYLRFAKRRRRRNLSGIAAVAAVAGVGLVAWTVMPEKTHDKARAASTVESSEPPEGSFTCTVVHITDGDTFRCGETDAIGREIRVRVSGIDARESDGSCAPGHPCADAPPQMAKAELTRVAEGQVLTCEAVGETYGRVAAFCARRDGTDLSCAMMRSGTVARWNKYWGRHRC
jgi:endonuclease YncB( thermonuclease family)